MKDFVAIESWRGIESFAPGIAIAMSCATLCAKNSRYDGTSARLCARAFLITVC